MSLRDRLETIRNEPLSVAVAAKGPMGIDKKQYAALKIHIHQTLLDRINLEAMEDLPPQRLKDELRNLVERLLEDENVVVNDIERRNLVRDIQYEVMGLGPIEPLAGRSDDLGHSGQQLPAGLRRAPRKAGTDRHPSSTTTRT